MAQLPDIEEIQLTVEAIESRPEPDRSGRDLEILESMRDRLLDALPLDTPADYASKDEQRALLGRIENARDALQSGG